MTLKRFNPLNGAFIKDTHLTTKGFIRIARCVLRYNISVARVTYHVLLLQWWERKKTLQHLVPGSTSRWQILTGTHKLTLQMTETLTNPSFYIKVNKANRVQWGVYFVEQNFSGTCRQSASPYGTPDMPRQDMG